MKRALPLYIFIGALILIALSLYLKKVPENYGNAADYFPNKPMVKLYIGGYENSGYVEIVDYVSEDKIQLKHLSGAMAGVLVYSLTPNEAILSYRSGEDLAGDRQQELDKNYIDLPSNSQETLLKGPIKKGTTWTVEVGNGTYTYEITGVDVKINTPAGDFTAIEVTYSYDSTLQVKNYYTKELGLVKVAIEDYYAMALSSVLYEFGEIKNMRIYDTLEYFFRQLQ